MPIEAQGALNNLDALARAVSTLQNQMAPIALAYQGTWANRVLPSQSNIGMLWRITDVGVGGGSWWWSDGTNLRPLNGYVSLWRRMSSISLPLATLTGSGAPQNFILPDYTVIPAGMLIPGVTRVWTMAKTRRLGNSGASASVATRLGSGASAGINDNSVVVQTISATVNFDTLLDGFADITSTTSYCGTGFITLNGTTTSSSFQDRITNFDCSGSNTSLVSIGVSSAFTVDQIALYGYEIGIYG